MMGGGGIFFFTGEGMRVSPARGRVQSGADGRKWRVGSRSRASKGSS